MEIKLPPEPARPWAYKPSSWNQRIRIALIALAATFISLYLGLYQWKVFESAWDPIFGDSTAKVLDSELSHLFTSWIRLPDAILGVLAYFSDAIFAIAGSERRWQDRPWLVILFGIAVIPLGIVSIILVILQGIVIKFWCFLCLITAGISLTLIFLAYDEVVSSIIYLYEIKKRGGWRVFWLSFSGHPSAEAYEAGEATLQKRRQANNNFTQLPSGIREKAISSTADKLGMWARVSEAILGVWLAISYFIFPLTSPSDIAVAALILLFACLSFIEKLNKMHLLQIFPAGWLLYLSYSYPTPWLPFGLQNYILIALGLLIFAIIPSHASDHPRPWKRFLQTKSNYSKEAK